MDVSNHLSERKMEKMKAFDVVKNEALDVDYDGFVQIMESGRQVDVFLPEEKTDSDGYLTWDVEHWSTTAPGKFIRTYTLKGRVLRDYTMHNAYDLKTDFHPELAVKIEIS